MAFAPGDNYVGYFAEDYDALVTAASSYRSYLKLYLDGLPQFRMVHIIFLRLQVMLQSLIFFCCYKMLV